MRKTYSAPSNSKVIVYAVIIAVILGIGVVVVQDIKVPTEHVSQEIAVNIGK